jgi:hypothetical protein
VITHTHRIYTHTHTHRCIDAASQYAYIDILQYLLQKHCKYAASALCYAAEYCTVQQLNGVLHAGIEGDSSAIAHAAKR